MMRFDDGRLWLCLAAFAQVDVGRTGAGGGDGTSWPDAYTNPVDALAANILNTNPLSVHPGGYDLQLKVKSQLVDEGLSLDNVLVNRNGQQRPRGEASEIGAYELLASPEGLILEIL